MGAKICKIERHLLHKDDGSRKKMIQVAWVKTKNVKVKVATVTF